MRAKQYVSWHYNGGVLNTCPLSHLVLAECVSLWRVCYPLCLSVLLARRQT